MKRIGLLSDTHSYLDDNMLSYFKDVDEIWHSGDFGSIEVVEKIQNLKPLRGVYGNIDGQDIRKICPLELHFMCEDVKVFMIHIGGFPPNYNYPLCDRIKNIQPNLFICGHSHILKVMRDKNINNLLHINPGAAGKQGFHKFRTMIRFSITGKNIHDLEVIELGLRGALE